MAIIPVAAGDRDFWIDEWISWILDSEQNECAVYWAGFLGRDREPGKKNWEWSASVANLMWTASATPRPPASDVFHSWGMGLKLVELTQRKLDFCNYKYIARKRYPIPVSSKEIFRTALRTSARTLKTV